MANDMNMEDVVAEGLKAAKEEDSSSSENVETSENIEKKIKKGKAKRKKEKLAAQPPPKKEIKKLPLIFLAIMFSTTLIPVIIYASDYMGKFMSTSNFLGSIGYKLGVGPSPKKRVISFYEKHDPSKLSSVPSIMAKHYGGYPKLIKKLERKYQDYGYFQGWDQDEAPMKLALVQLSETKDFIVNKFNELAPRQVRTAIRNASFNLGKIYKKLRRFYRKHVWPIIEPLFAVPDEKTARAQKRKDAAEANARKYGKGAKGGKAGRKSTEYRDDVEEENYDAPDL